MPLTTSNALSKSMMNRSLVDKGHNNFYSNAAVGLKSSTKMHQGVKENGCGKFKACNRTLEPTDMKIIAVQRRVDEVSPKG